MEETKIKQSITLKLNEIPIYRYDFSSFIIIYIINDLLIEHAQLKEKMKL